MKKLYWNKIDRHYISLSEFSGSFQIAIHEPISLILYASFIGYNLGVDLYPQCKLEKTSSMFNRKICEEFERE